MEQSVVEFTTNMRSTSRHCKDCSRFRLLTKILSHLNRKTLNTSKLFSCFQLVHNFKKFEHFVPLFESDKSFETLSCTWLGLSLLKSRIQNKHPRFKSVYVSGFQVLVQQYPRVSLLVREIQHKQKAFAKIVLKFKSSTLKQF